MLSQHQVSYILVNILYESFLFTYRLSFIFSILGILVSAYGLICLYLYYMQY